MTDNNSPRLYPCRTCHEPVRPKWAPVRLAERWIEQPFCDHHVAEAKQKARMIREQFFIAGFDKMWDWSLETYPADDPVGATAKATAIDWMERGDSNPNGDAWLFIYGPVGSGKSGLAWAIAKANVEKWLYDETRFVNVRQLLGRMRRSFGTDEPYDPMDELTKVWLLVLDDLGAERITDWTREWLATLIEDRYTQEHATIVTSNYSPSQLARRLGHDDPIIGKRIVSRMVEDAVVLKLDRADLRLKLRAA
jgi:DNA replication protein DnaC